MMKRKMSRPMGDRSMVETEIFFCLGSFLLLSFDPLGILHYCSGFSISCLSFVAMWVFLPCLPPLHLGSSLSLSPFRLSPGQVLVLLRLSFAFCF